MVNFKRILFPVEFTPQCQIAARHIASYARLFDAEIILLHVEELPFEPYVWEPPTDWLTRHACSIPSGRIRRNNRCSDMLRSAIQLKRSFAMQRMKGRI